MKKILYVLPKLPIKPRVCCISTSTEIQTENKYQVPISWKSNKALNWGIKAQNWPAMGVIEVNFQTTKKMNRLGSGFDLCTLTKKKDHSLSCSQQRAEENAVNFTFYQPLCSTKPLSINTVLLSSFFSLFFLSFLSEFDRIFHLLHFALFSAMRPWMFFPPKNVSCDFKKAAAFWRVFFSNCLPPRPTKLRFTNEGVLCSPRLRILCTTGIGHKTFNAEPARSSTPYDVSREKCPTLMMQKSSFEFVYLILGSDFLAILHT